MSAKRGGKDWLAKAFEDATIAKDRDGIDPNSESAMELKMRQALAHCGFCFTEESRGRGIADVVPQFQVSTRAGLFRLDFAVFRRVGRLSLKLDVEVDGAEHHRMNKEQAERDNRRSRALVHDGWRVVRYAGSEVDRDPSGCALDLAAIVIAWVDAASRFR